MLRKEALRPIKSQCRQCGNASVLNILHEQDCSQTSKTEIGGLHVERRSGILGAVAARSASTGGTGLVELALADILGCRAKLALDVVVKVARVAEVVGRLQVEDTLDEIDLRGFYPAEVSTARTREARQLTL